MISLVKKYVTCGINRGVEPKVCARRRVNRLHRFVREPMPESAE
jgi:hypothetical protein